MCTEPAQTEETYKGSNCRRFNGVGVAWPTFGVLAVSSGLPSSERPSPRGDGDGRIAEPKRKQHQKYCDQGAGLEEESEFMR